MGFSWDRRIARAGELAEKYPAVAELLKFYQQLARFQKGIYEKLASASEHDIPVLLPSFPELIALVKRTGSPALAQAAATLAQDSEDDRLMLLESIWQHQVESSQITGEDAFFAQALLQPYAEYLAAKSGGAGEEVSTLCPFCGSKPLLGVMRQEGDGGKKFLLCPLCSTEWPFRRLLCPNCGEESKDKLPVFAADEFDYVRVDACDNCHTYMKSIDLTKNGNAVPMVDELATISLNLWAQENHYQKLRPNLFGV